jgi:FkbM family methyltransferase
LLKPGAVCLDIGANAGLYSLLFSRKAGVVYAFEPLPMYIHRICRMIRTNRIENVVIVPCAVSGRTSVTGFEEGTTHATGRISRNGKQPVITTSCDEFCQQFGVRPDMIKIDVEGAEYDVLLGAERTLTLHRPVILLSVHSDNLRRDCLTYLEGLGYAARPLPNPDVIGRGFDTEFVLMHRNELVA